MVTIIANERGTKWFLVAKNGCVCEERPAGGISDVEWMFSFYDITNSNKLIDSIRVDFSSKNERTNERTNVRREMMEVTHFLLLL
mmetsp:Transcript_42110/g.101261  ORF Transcript_42110/g.101261 Transcript_42110/m.101261 type:complete len:85 (+) Transcript_42110:2116-2370(+)